jgi:hypothetical protein
LNPSETISYSKLPILRPTYEDKNGDHGEGTKMTEAQLRHTQLPALFESF